MVMRKIGAVLRGKATPLQVMLATVLGGLLGFVPGFFLPQDLGGGFAQAPGLILLLLCSVLVANANLAVFGVTLLVSKLLSLVLLPVSYQVGVWLLDGPLAGLFEALIHTKVTAWFGLEYYATTGGLVLGLLVGVVLGVLLNKAMRAIRSKMADVEESSERYQKYASKWWVRLITWLFLGKGKGKKTSWRELSERQKLGLPVRVVGVALSVVLVGGAWGLQSYFSTPLLTSGLRGGLEAVNGATVDVERASLGLGSGELRVQGLAMADLQDLSKDVFAADALVATIDTGELLRRRLVIDELTAQNARTGSVRGEPGVALPGAAPEHAPAPEEGAPPTLEDYVEEFEVWRQRLAQWREWLEAFSGGGDEEAGDPEAEPTPEEKQQQRTAQEPNGLAMVVAQHLLRDAPRIVIRKVTIEGLGFSIDGQQDKLDIDLRNLSDAPSLLAEVAAAKFRVQSDWLDLQLNGPAAGGEQVVGVSLAIKDVSVDALFSKLRIDGKPPVSGGTLEFGASGSVGGLGDGATIELPLQVKMKGATFAFSGLQPTKVDELLLPVGLSGSLTSPSVSFDGKVFQQALLDAGQQQLANFVQGHAAELFGGAVPLDLTQSPDKIVDEAKQQLAEEAKKAQDEAKQKLEEEAKKAAEKAAESARKKLLEKNLPGGLKGLLPGGGGGK